MIDIKFQNVCFSMVKLPLFYFFYFQVMQKSMSDVRFDAVMPLLI